MNLEEVSAIKYHESQFDIQYVYKNDDDLHVYRGRPLEEVWKNIKENCHVLTKGENQCWRIAVQKPSGFGHARSKTSEDFYYHSDLSFNKYQPSHLVLFCEKEDSLGGGISKVIPLSAILKRLTPKAIEVLKMPIYNLNMVEGFESTFMKGYFEKKLPILYVGPDGQTSIRLKQDMFTLNNKDQTQESMEALNQLKVILETVCMFLCYADYMLGTGVLKCGTGRVVRYQDNGFMIPTRIICEKERNSESTAQV